MKSRTIEEFVEELVAEGRKMKYIKAVAQSCRWQHYKEEIKIAYKNLKKRINQRKK